MVAPIYICIYLVLTTILLGIEGGTGPTKTHHLATIELLPKAEGRATTSGISFWVAGNSGKGERPKDLATKGKVALIIHLMKKRGRVTTERANKIYDESRHKQMRPKLWRDRFCSKPWQKGEISV